jgi:hypothetical protein
MTEAAAVRPAHATTAERQAPFTRESDMLAPVAALAADLASGLPGHRSQNAYVLFEVPTAAGVPDVLRVAFDATQLRRRAELGMAPVVDHTALRVLLATANGPAPLYVVARRARVTTAHLRRTVVPTLVEAGWLLSLRGRGDQTLVKPRLKYRPLTRSVVTVEAKRNDWRSAIAQARRHQGCADRAYIAIDAATPGPLLRLAQDLSAAGIGLVTVHAETRKAVLVTRPAAWFPHTDEHQLIGERAWSLVLEGRTCWDTFDVFGRDLTANR